MARGLGGILGNDTLQQLVLWNVAGAVIGAALGPYLNELTATVNAATPLVPLSPADAADLVIRNVWPRDEAAAESARSGVNGARFDALVQLAGNAPDPTSLAVALRRGLIDLPTYQRGVRQGRLRDEWSELVRQLSVQQPSPQAMLDAYLEGQLDEGEARDKFHKLGGDPDYFDILFHTQGQAPTPVQAQDMANRGIIPWAGTGPNAVSFEQAFLEGPWRNKWLAPFRKAAEYFPPPRTITAMYKEGSLSRPRALELLAQQGVPADLAAAYLQSGSNTKTQATRDLAMSTITTLYRDRLLDTAGATAALEGLGYDASEAGFILSIEDVRVIQRFLDAAVGRIHTLYVGHKIDRAQALATLAQLQVPAANVAELVAVWDYERAATVKILTASEVAAALKLGFLTQPEAQARLEQQGYQPHDAWLYLSIHTKLELPDQPVAGTVTSSGAP